MSAGNMTIRASHKRAARDFFQADLDSDDTYAMSEDVSEDESVASYQDQMMANDDTYRMLSPKSTMDMPMMLASHHQPTKKTTNHHTNTNAEDGVAEKRMRDVRVTIWNWREQRKLSGNSAPFKKNLQEYLRKHPDWEEYIGQDKDENGKKSFAPKKRRKEMKPDANGDAPRRAGAQRNTGMLPSMDQSMLLDSRRRASMELGTAPHKETMQWRKQMNEATKQKDQEAKEASRWREFSAIQHIIDHYSQGPSKSPFHGDNAMMLNA